MYMHSDTVIKSAGMRVLAESLGILEAERFITLILREPFDYTEWQRDLYGDLPVEDLYERIKTYETKQAGVAQ
jgi:hypothetical protein